MAVKVNEYKSPKGFFLFGDWLFTTLDKGDIIYFMHILLLRYKYLLKLEKTRGNRGVEYIGVINPYKEE